MGIGTTDPGAKLEINGGTNDTIISLYNDISTSSTSGFNIRGTAARQHTIYGNSSADYMLTLNNAGSAEYNLVVNGETTLNSHTQISGKLGIYTSGQSSYISNSHIAYLYYSAMGGGSYPFNDNGNLIIQPRTSAERDIVFANGSTTPTAAMVIKSSGNIGVGTTDPGSKLHVYGTTTNLVAIGGPDEKLGWLTVGRNVAEVSNSN